MTIEDRDLKDGTRLEAKYKGETWTAEVGQTEEGLRIKLEDGRLFKSLSSAGSAIMGGKACNGWRFWSLAGEAKEEEAKKERKAKKATKPKQNGGPISRMEDGRYWCSNCMEPFETADDLEPTECPQGHKADDLPEAV